MRQIASSSSLSAGGPNTRIGCAIVMPFYIIFKCQRLATHLEGICLSHIRIFPYIGRFRYTYIAYIYMYIFTHIYIWNSFGLPLYLYIDIYYMDIYIIYLYAYMYRCISTRISCRKPLASLHLGVTWSGREAGCIGPPPGLERDLNSQRKDTSLIICC